MILSNVLFPIFTSPPLNIIFFDTLYATILYAANNNSIIKGAPKLRLIGYAPITSNYSNAEVKTGNIGVELNYFPNINSSIVQSHKVAEADSSVLNPLYSVAIIMPPYLYFYLSYIYHINIQ